jgi:GT2 family glycosyltransferase
MDDDTLPTPTALEALTRCPYFTKPETGFLACLALWKDGSPHVSNGTNFDLIYDWRHRVLEERCIPVVSASFVGVMFNAAAVNRIGLPIKEYFIWSDDIEYTLRVSRQFRCYVVLDSKVYHQTKENVGSIVTDNHSMKTQCYFRNVVCTLLLSPVSWLRRIKRVLGFVLKEFGRAKSFSRLIAVIRFSLSGVSLYCKVRKMDLHE